MKRSVVVPKRRRLVARNVRAVAAQYRNRYFRAYTIRLYNAFASVAPGGQSQSRHKSQRDTPNHFSPTGPRKARMCFVASVDFSLSPTSFTFVLPVPPNTPGLVSISRVSVDPTSLAAMSILSGGSSNWTLPSDDDHGGPSFWNETEGRLRPRRTRRREAIRASRRRLRLRLRNNSPPTTRQGCSW
jgi:hypothetical protein